jgi:hypothetical protein
MGYITIRIKGDSESCNFCDRDVEVFSNEAKRARFLIIRLQDRPVLGGGKCPKCQKYVCISCAVKTVYGKGLRRLHCPDCGLFLVGLRRTEDESQNMGAFLDEPPEFSGRKRELQGI